MTKHGKKKEPRGKAATWISYRLFLALLGLAVALGAGVALIDKRELPEKLRESKAVSAVYETRDRAISASREYLLRDMGAKPENTEKKQQGYPKEDRKKLEEIISKGAQGHD